MNRYVVLIAVISAVIVAGCTQTGTETGEQGEFELLISDQPTEIENFDYVNTSFSELRVYSSNVSENETENSSEDFETIELENNPTVDLAQLQGDRASSIITSELDTGNYSAVHLQVSDVNASIDNEATEVTIPSERLKINKPFTIAPNTTTSFVFDISVIQRGQTGSYNLLPVVSESGVAGQDVEVERVGSQGEAAQEQDQENLPQQAEQ